MHPDDKKFVYKGLSVIYKHRRSLQDRRHLLVIFSGGFGPRRGYDLNGSVVDGIRADILWIRDNFDGDFSYYIRTGKRGALVAEAVAALIEKIRLERGLEKHHCTFIGISKGGTGALYHALANDYPNVITVSPRMRIGSGNRELRPNVLKHLIGEDTDAGVEELDSILPTLLANDPNRARNIYLFTSPSDGQYETEILPFLSDYERYENFNYILTETPLVARHRDVAPYNIPLLLATIAALGEGAVPHYGLVRNGLETFTSSVPVPSLETVRERQETVCKMTSLALRNGRFFPEGVLFVKGQSTKGTGQISRKLVLASGVHRRSYSLKSMPDDKLSRTYFENEFCNYSNGKFGTVRQEGIDLAKLDAGRHELRLELEHNGISVSVESVPSYPFEASLAMGKHLVRLHSTGTSVALHKGSILPGRLPGSQFKPGQAKANGNKVHVEGRYVLPGVRTPQRGTVGYYLVLTKAGTHTPVASYPLVTSPKKFQGGADGDPLGDYGFTCFNTPSGEGISLDGTAPGKYDVHVTASAGSIASSHALGLRLTVTGAGDAIECSLRSAMPVPGGKVAAAWAAHHRPRLARRVRRNLGRIKRRLLATKP
ncbi:hypothetical protein ACFY5D_08110 [Paeniglutamicibacter sp. NPDC012692]|uniref:hypothetical protein n=1 Tax=Paeniglutamicibacter sp. NPDC012692 TaxID=3364388 RepID=UPI0036796C7C